MLNKICLFVYLSGASPKQLLRYMLFPQNYNRFTWQIDPPPPPKKTSLMWWAPSIWLWRPRNQQNRLLNLVISGYWEMRHCNYRSSFENFLCIEELCILALFKTECMLKIGWKMKSVGVSSHYFFLFVKSHYRYQRFCTNAMALCFAVLEGLWFVEEN